MPRIDPERRKQLLNIHGWTAVCLGLLLYLVVVTGMVSVLADEIGNWSSPLHTRPADDVPVGIDRAMRSLSDQVPARFHEEVSVFAQAGGRLQTFFHAHEIHPESGDLEEIGVEFDLDPETFEILDRREGWIDDIESRNRPNALVHFLTELHINLHMPDPFGLWLTGLAGFALSIALVSGFFMQARPLRKIFTWRRRAELTVASQDAHVVTGSWILPFVLVLAITGSYFSFVDSIGFPAMAEIVYEGDETALFEALFGVSTAEDPRSAAPADIDAMISDTTARSGSAPIVLVVERWGQADSIVTLFTAPAEGTLVERSYVYGGAGGEFHFEKPLFGTSPSAAGSLAGLIGPLHFGNFAGLLSKVIWTALGFMGAYVVMAGLGYWCRRRRDEPAWRVADRAVYWMGYGLPMALAATPYGYFPSRAVDVVETGSYMGLAFFSAAALATLLSFTLRSSDSYKRLLQGISGVLLLGLPWLRQLCGGPSWPIALEYDLYTIVVLDIALALTGIIFLLPAVIRNRYATTGETRGQETMQAARTE